MTQMKKKIKELNDAMIYRGVMIYRDAIDDSFSPNFPCRAIYALGCLQGAICGAGCQCEGMPKYTSAGQCVSEYVGVCKGIASNP